VRENGPSSDIPPESGWIIHPPIANWKKSSHKACRPVEIRGVESPGIGLVRPLGDARSPKLQSHRQDSNNRKDATRENKSF